MGKSRLGSRRSLLPVDMHGCRLQVPIPPRKGSPSSVEAQAFPGTWPLGPILLSVGYCPPPLKQCKSFKAGLVSLGLIGWLRVVEPSLMQPGLWTALLALSTLGEFGECPGSPEGPAFPIWHGGQSPGPGLDANLPSTGLQGGLCHLWASVSLDHLQSPLQFGHYIKSMLRKSSGPTNYPILFRSFAFICINLHGASNSLFFCCAAFASICALVSPLNDMNEEQVRWPEVMSL